jgi:hypothetical protein
VSTTAVSWRSHAATGRPHAFSRAGRHVSDCRLAVAVDCPQELLPHLEDVLVVLHTAVGVATVRHPLHACGLCRRAVKARARAEVRKAA